MNYTIGNWTVASLTTDTISTAKSLSLTDLDYTSDYSVSKDGTEEAILTNITGASLVSPEALRFGKTPIVDVYSGTDIPSISRLPAKGGVRTLCEVKFNLQAVNSVSGQEVLLPFKGWICLQLPTASVVTSAAVLYALKRTISSAFATGGVTEAMEVAIARGDYIPE